MLHFILSFLLLASPLITFAEDLTPELRDEACREILEIVRSPERQREIQKHLHRGSVAVATNITDVFRTLQGAKSNEFEDLRRITARAKLAKDPATFLELMRRRDQGFLSRQFFGTMYSPVAYEFTTEFLESNPTASQKRSFFQSPSLTPDLFFHRFLKEQKDLAALSKLRIPESWLKNARAWIAANGATADAADSLRHYDLLIALHVTPAEMRKFINNQPDSTRRALAHKYVDSLDSFKTAAEFLDVAAGFKDKTLIVDLFDNGQTKSAMVELTIRADRAKHFNLDDSVLLFAKSQIDRFTDGKSFGANLIRDLLMAQNQVLQPKQFVRLMTTTITDKETKTEHKYVSDAIYNDPPDTEASRQPSHLETFFRMRPDIALARKVVDKNITDPERIWIAIEPMTLQEEDCKKLRRLPDWAWNSAPFQRNIRELEKIGRAHEELLRHKKKTPARKIVDSLWGVTRFFVGGIASMFGWTKDKLWDTED